MLRSNIKTFKGKFQSKHMVINNHGYVVPFEHYIDNRFSYNGSFLNFQDMYSDSPNQMMPLAGSGLKAEGDHLKI